MNDNGHHQDVNLEEAFKTIEKIHLKDCIDSTIALASMYYMAKHVPQDYKKAFELSGKAAETGNAEAIGMQGFMLVEGLGIASNTNRGIELLKYAAERGDIPANGHLARYYFDGEHVEQSYEKAANYYNASLEDPFSLAGLAFLYEFGLGTEQSLKTAESYYVEALKTNNILATVAIAHWYIVGKYYVKDHAKAFQILTKGAATKDDENIAFLAMLMACSSNSDIYAPQEALLIIEEQMQWKDQQHSYELDLAKAMTLGALGKFEQANEIIQQIKFVYEDPENSQYFKRQRHATERFLDAEEELASFKSCVY
jgi:TPR repeat protein